jgi:hypothetical protein
MVGIPLSILSVSILLSRLPTIDLVFILACIFLLIGIMAFLDDILWNETLLHKLVRLLSRKSVYT